MASFTECVDFVHILGVLMRGKRGLLQRQTGWAQLPITLLPMPFAACDASCLGLQTVPLYLPNPPYLLRAPPVAPSLTLLQSCVGGGLCGLLSLPSVRAAVAG